MYRTMNTRGKKALRALMMTALILFSLASPAARASEDALKIAVSQVSNVSNSAFTYRLKPLGAGNPMPEGSTKEGYTFTIVGTDTAVITLPGAALQGIYRYELFQVIGAEKAGYTYDRRVYTIEVHAEAEEGAKIIVLNQNGDKEGLIEFENNYRVPPSDPKLMTDPPVKKTVSGNPRYTTAFEFTLKAEDAASPMPAGSVRGIKTIRITGSGEGLFGTWSYDKEGTYYYTVRETDTGAGGYTYDKTVYTITDTVKEESSKLVVYRVVKNHLNKPVSAFTFINKFSEGKEGPYTGDDMDSPFLLTAFALSGALAIFSVIYLILGGKRKRGGK